MIKLDAVDKMLRTALKQPKLKSRPFIILEKGRLEPEAFAIKTNSAASTAHISAKYGRMAEEDIFISTSQGKAICKRVLRNISGKVLRLVELGLQLDGLRFGGDRKKDFFYNTENPRIYGRMAIPVHLKRTQEMALNSEFDVLAGTRWADPGVVSERIGASPYQPFPATLLSNYAGSDGLVHGTLSQRVFFHNHLLSHHSGAVRWEVFSSCKAVAWREWQPGEVLEDDWYLGLTHEAGSMDRIFSNYADELRLRLPVAQGRSRANRRSLLWDSWNDGIHHDIDEPRLLKMADFLREELPTVEWLQVDDGYASLAKKVKWAHGLGMCFEGKKGLDWGKFPRGLKYFADSVRERGLRPAIWIGGLVASDAPLHKAHPEWFSNYDYRLEGKSNPLDISLPEARKYMVQSLDYFLRESGFEGVKHDFWSYVFEDSHPLLAGKAKTGYEWRSWWLEEFRKRLPADGYLQTGCDIVMGNPFLGEHFNNYRYGIDIGAGKWEHVLTSMQWGTACFATQTGDLFIPNSDSIGLLPRLTDDEARTCITYCLISRSLVEVSGWLYQQPKHPRLAWVRKAICCPNNGQKVFFADYDYRDEKSSVPSIWYLKTPHFSLCEGAAHLPLRTVAVFNLEDKEKNFRLDARKLGLAQGNYTATDTWSLESCSLADLHSFTVPGRGSRLFSISRNDGTAQVLDADIEIASAASAGKHLRLELANRGKLTLALSSKPSKVSLGGKNLRHKLQKGKGNWLLSCKIEQAGLLEL